jgi:2-polyprenyl-3-methyl-5-hydroxy-6-metoxy-1,4-benzoquinol methylase
MPINRYEDEGVANYWNNKYEQNYHPYLHGRQNKVLELISRLELPKGSKCLELGCGGGQNAIEYANKGLEVHGIDSSEELLKTAQELALKESNLSFSNVDLNQKMPFENETFDLVVVVGTLQYLMEPSTCIKDVARILKPGGYFIVCQRNALSFNVLRRPLSFLSCLISQEGFEWGGRPVSTSVGTSVKGTKEVLIKRMVKFSNLTKWFGMAGLETSHVEGYTPDFSISPKLFRLLDKLLNFIPGLYRFSHVVLASGKKAITDS